MENTEKWIVAWWNGAGDSFFRVFQSENEAIAAYQYMLTCSGSTVFFGEVTQSNSTL